MAAAATAVRIGWHRRGPVTNLRKQQAPTNGPPIGPRHLRPCHAVPRCVATRAGLRCRRRRRGPKVRQDRGQADESIARSAPLGLAAPLPPRGAGRPRFLRPAGPTRRHDLDKCPRPRRRGTHPVRVPNDEEVDVGEPPWSRVGKPHRPSYRGRLRSLPAEQHAPRRVPPSHRPWPASGSRACVIAAPRRGYNQEDVRPPRPAS